MNRKNQRDIVEAGKLLGGRLREIRLSRGFSLEDLAAQTGVSKLTLGQIERGEGNPTLSVVWKIANGLSIPVTALIPGDSEVSTARRDNGLKIVSANDAFTAEPLFRASKPQSFELYRGYLKPNAEYRSDPHSPGVVEFVTVMSGELHMKVQEETYKLKEFESIRFHGDREHVYINPTGSTVVLHFVISYNGPAGAEGVIFGG